MKRITLYILALAVSLCGFSQGVDRTKAPKPGPAPVININDPATFTLPNGLKVFVVTNTKLPQVTAVLTIDRLSLLEGDKAGMLGLAGSLMRRGTTTMKKAELDEAVDFLGAELSTSATSVSGGALKDKFPKLMALMADVTLRPAFDAEELEKERKRALSGLAQQKDDPNAIASKVAAKLMFGNNHPYGENETEATLKAVTVDDIKQYHNTWWKPNIAYLVLVGDITVAEAQKLATQHFGSWARAEVPKLSYPAVKTTDKTYIALVDRPTSVQSVINIGAPVSLAPGAPDAIPTSVMATILGGGFSSRLNQTLREKYGFTYGARGGVSPDRLVGRFSAGASVRNEKTDSAIGQFLQEFTRIRTTTPAVEELSSIKNYMSGGFARSLEEPGTIASFALNVARYGLPKDYYRNYLTRLSAVNAATVQQMAEKYVPANNLVITIVGNAKEIAKGLEKYGEVRYFDKDGNPTEAPVVKEAAAGVTPQSILQKAIEAYGGAAALANIKDISMEGTVSIMGQNLQVQQRFIRPDGFSMKVAMGGMALMSQTKVGQEYTMTQQGMQMPLDEEMKADFDAKAMVFEELYYLEKNYALQLKGIEKVDGKDAYHLVITRPGSTKATDSWYDVNTGLMIQQSAEQDMGPMGKVTAVTKIKEYKMMDGILLPVKISIETGPMNQEIDMSTIKINSGLTPADLK